MRFLPFVALARVLLVAFALVGCSGTGAELDVERDAALTRVIDEGMKKAKIPGALVGIWQNGKEPFVRTFGVRDKTTLEPMSLDFNMRIGSVTKTFVTQAMLQLVEKGLLGLDDPISMHVDSVPNGDNITLRQLAGMRSGLYSYTNIVLPDWPNSRMRQWLPRELADVGLGKDPVFAPGANFDYSNTNTVLIGLAIEKVTKKPLPAVLDELIIKPLKLTRTYLPAEDTFPDPHSKGYGVFPNDPTIYETSTWNGSWGWAAGSMISTFEEMRVWTEVFAKGSMLKPETLAERNKFGPADDEGVGVTYGLGIENDNGWLGHNGNTPGYITYTFYLPSEKTTMVLMMNASIDLLEMHRMIQEIVKIVSPSHPWPEPPPTD